MKKRYLILAGILAASMLAAGCGKKSSVAPEQKVEATVTPTVTEAAKSDVVADIYRRYSKYQECDGNQERDNHKYCVHK